MITDDRAMLWPLSCAWLLAVWSGIYLIDLYARRTKLDAYLNFVEATGIVVHPLQIRWYTGGVESLLHRWAMLDRPLVRRICHAWFSIGAAVSMAAMGESLLTVPYRLPAFMLGFLSLNVWSTISPWLYTPPPSSSPSTAPTQTHAPLQGASWSSRGALVPVIPGVNVPWSHMPLFVASLVVAGVVHELGHAIAACAEKINVNGFGVFVLLVYPGAFTEIDNATLHSATRIQRLRVYTAGIWHNVVLALVAIACLHGLPLAVSPLYMHSKGVMVTSVASDSSFGGPRGLAVEDVVFAINQCKVYNAASWTACLRQMQTSVYGYCLPHAKLEHRDHTVKMTRVDDEMSCCDSNSTASHMCFHYTNNTRVAYACLSGRVATDHYMCNVSTPCTARTTCAYPALFNSSALLRVAVANASRPVLYVAHVPDVFADITVTSYVPRWRGLLSPPLFLPPLLELFLKYTITFSMALAMLNAVPCFTLDGHHMTQWLCNDLLCRSSKGGGFTRRSNDKGRLFSNALLYYGTTVLSANIFIALAGLVR